MIRNNLAALMGERGLKITRVAKETDISRNTITSIAQNDSDMIRMETINTLCNYLGVTPCEFFEYVPLDVTFTLFLNKFSFVLEQEFIENSISIYDFDAELIMDVITPSGKTSYDLNCVTEYKNIVFGPENMQIKVMFEDKTEKDLFVKETYNKLNSVFYQDIYKKLKNIFLPILKEAMLNNLKTTSFYDSQKELLESAIKKDFDIEIVSDVFRVF